MRNRCIALFLGLAVLAVGVCPPVFGWGGKTHKKVTSDAYFIMPEGFRRFLGMTGSGKDTRHPSLKALLEGAVEPDSKLKDFQNHVFHIHGYKMGNGPFRVEELVKEIVTDIQNKAPKAQIIQKLGWVSHYTADLVQPLHTGVATWEGIEEKDYHSKCEKDGDAHIYTYGVQFDGAMVLQRVSARIVYEALWANQYYGMLEQAYTEGKKYDEARNVLSACYSRAVNNVLDVWYTIWARSGGKTNPKIDTRPRYFPPFDEKKAGSALPRNHNSLIDSNTLEAPGGQVPGSLQPSMERPAILPPAFGEEASPEP
jgi:hypothetical protein